MSFITNRTDVSDWLIHFVRDRDPETDFPGDEEDYESFVGELDPDAPAISVLRQIVDLGGLLPGFSFRPLKGSDDVRTTIYGGSPAVCFTEAPLNGFAQYVLDRGRSERCSPYGVCLLKREIFAAGGRPVIYGLSGSNQPHLIEDTRFRRILDVGTLPLAEQFRYVAYDPGRTKPLDWTHEREWRWIATDERRHQVWHHGPGGIGPYPGLPLFLGNSDGGIFSRVGLITSNRDEAHSLSKSLLRYVDANGNNYGTPYSKEILARSFIIPLDEAVASGASRIEDLAPQFLVLPPSRAQPTPELIQRVQMAIMKARAASAAAADEFLRTANRTKSGHIADMYGGAWVITEDSASPVTAALLQLSLARVTGGLYYIVDAIKTHSPDQSLGFAEAAANAACDSLCADLGDIFAVRTWED